MVDRITELESENKKLLTKIEIHNNEIYKVYEDLDMIRKINITLNNKIKESEQQIHLLIEMQTKINDSVSNLFYLASK